MQITLFLQQRRDEPCVTSSLSILAMPRKNTIPNINPFTFPTPKVVKYTYNLAGWWSERESWARWGMLGHLCSVPSVIHSFVAVMLFECIFHCHEVSSTILTTHKEQNKTRQRQLECEVQTSPFLHLGPSFFFVHGYYQYYAQSSPTFCGRPL